MSEELAKRWKILFQKNCSQWNDALKRQYINIVNDPDDVDEIELASSLELIQKVNGKKPIE